LFKRIIKNKIRRQKMPRKNERKEQETIEISSSGVSRFVACLVKGEKKEFIHLGALFGEGVTACDRKIGDIIFDSCIKVNCPECVAETNYRDKHPEAARKRMGIITHKGER
jgi:hypothetical protein